MLEGLLDMDGGETQAAEGEHTGITWDATGLILPFGCGSAGENLEEPGRHGWKNRREE